MRTLKLMLSVYLRELQDALLMDESQCERLFPRLDCLLHEHQNFLQMLKTRRRESLETGSDKNYCISNIGDILIAQVPTHTRACAGSHKYTHSILQQVPELSFSSFVF